MVNTITFNIIVWLLIRRVDIPPLAYDIRFNVDSFITENGLGGFHYSKYELFFMLSKFFQTNHHSNCHYFSFSNTLDFEEKLEICLSSKLNESSCDSIKITAPIVECNLWKSSVLSMNVSQIASSSLPKTEIPVMSIVKYFFISRKE